MFEDGGLMAEFEWLKLQVKLVEPDSFSDLNESAKEI